MRDTSSVSMNEFLVWFKLLIIPLLFMMTSMYSPYPAGAYLKSYSENETTLYNKDGACWDTDIIPGEGQTVKNLNNILHLFTGQKAIPVWLIINQNRNSYFILVS